MAQESKPAEDPLFGVIEEITRTTFSRVLLARELQTGALVILKIARQQVERGGKSLSGTDRRYNVDNNLSIENEVNLWRTIRDIRRHRAFLQLRPVKKNGEHLAIDKETKGNYLAEPYYAGFTLADRINRNGYSQRIFVYLVRKLNLRLLRFISARRTPKKRNLLRSFGVPDRIVKPSSEIKSGKPLSTYKAITIVNEIADFLESLHGCGYVHLDLKPSNVMSKTLQWPGRESTSEIVIIDLGESQRVGGSVISRTATWGAPEQGNRLDIKTAQSQWESLDGTKAQPSMDIYALGQILGYLLTGIHPKQLPANLKYTDLKAVQKKVAKPLIDFMAICLAEHPSERPSAKQAHTYLSQIEKVTAPKIWHRWLALAIVLFTATFTLSAGISLHTTCTTQTVQREWQQVICTMFSVTVPTAVPTLASPTIIPTAVPPTTAITPTTIRTATVSVTPTEIRDESVVTATIPTATVSTVTQAPTSTPIETPTPPFIPPTQPSSPAISLVLLNEIRGEDGVQSCNELGSWNVGDSNNKVKIAFRLLRGLVANERVELQVQKPNGVWITARSGSSAISGDDFYERNGIDLFEGNFGDADLVAFGMRQETTYLWRVIVKTTDGLILGESGACNFVFSN